MIGTIKRIFIGALTGTSFLLICLLVMTAASLFLSRSTLPRWCSSVMDRYAQPVQVAPETLQAEWDDLKNRAEKQKRGNP